MHDGEKPERPTGRTHAIPQDRSGRTGFARDRSGFSVLISSHVHTCRPVAANGSSEAIGLFKVKVKRDDCHCSTQPHGVTVEERDPRVTVKRGFDAKVQAAVGSHASTVTWKLRGPRPSPRGHQGQESEAP